MSNNKKNSPRNTEKHGDYYNLKTDAVNRLVNADKKDYSKDKQLKDPAKQYRSGFLDRIPAPVKALFVKFWFNGAVCYFIFWGLGLYVTDHIDMMVILSVVLGMITDVLVNNTLRFIETIPGENDKWMMFPKKRFWTFLANILYAFAVLFCVIQTYEAIALIYVEPILFGIFYMLFDLLFIGMKYLMKTIINDAKNKVNKQ